MLAAKYKRLLESMRRRPRRSEPLQYDGADGLEEVSRWLAAHKQAVSLETKLQDLREIIIAIIEPWRSAQCEVSGEHPPSVVIETRELGAARVTFQNKWSKIPASREPALRKELGDDYDQFFESEITLSLKKEVAKNPKRLASVLRTLRNALGPLFEELFESDCSIVPTKAFQEAAPLDAEARAEFGIKQAITLTALR